MQPSTQPIRKDLVLIGGGHSHAIALKRWSLNPVAGVRLTLITDVFHTPYSGMLPGYVAGLYTFDQCHIDLQPLAQAAQARLIPAQAIGLDLQTKRVLCAQRPPVAFDVLSIDIGSTPSLASVPGAREYAIPVKPISKFLADWDQIVDEVAQSPHQPLHLGIVGGGAGGVELALNVQARLHQLYQNAAAPTDNLTLHLFHRGQELLESRSLQLRRRMQTILHQRGIQVHLEAEVVEITSDWVRCQSGLVIKCDRLFWVTQAAAAPWVWESGLATDAEGFIQINDRLQSVSHAQVFAAGDIATMLHHPRPKAGVFAVRQGKPLINNLRRALLEQPLQPFIPQSQFLILVGMGDRTAVASRGSWSIGPHPLLWQWKDGIDRKFMDQFSYLLSYLPRMPEPQENRQAGQGSRKVRDHLQGEGSAKGLPADAPGMRCAGCGSKVGSGILEQALQRVKQDQTGGAGRDDIVIGLDAPDDAAVVQVPVGQVMVQTVDYFRALVSDPFLFGQISTTHCLSDLFAMGATPQGALAIATLPYGSDDKTAEMLYQLLSGATITLQQAQAVLLGGHTTEGSELAFGLSCNGLAQPEHLLRKSGMQPGQTLILTKALGTGTLFAADMRLQAKGRWIDAALQSMLLSNQLAAAYFRHYGATACTDITGFGLLGHLTEMLLASHVGVELELAALPVLPGADETLRQGIVSSLHPQNLRFSRYIHNQNAVSDRPLYPLLFDPQTSGGLLAAVPATQASACLSALRDNGYSHSQIIGCVVPKQDPKPPVSIILSG